MNRVRFPACFAAMAALALSAQLAFAEDIRAVGKGFMFSEKQIAFSIIDNPDFSTLAKALKVTKLERALVRRGSFTLLAPDNAAFARIAADEFERLFRRVNRKELAKIIACHVIANDALAGAKLRPALEKNKHISVTTLGGCVLRVELENDTLLITDESGAIALVTYVDVVHSNGMIEIIDRVLQPKS